MSLKAHHLTPREQELAQGLFAAKSNKEIAYDLGLSENSVKTYLNRLYWKHGVFSRMEMVNRIRRENLLQCTWSMQEAWYRIAGATR